MLNILLFIHIIISVTLVLAILFQRSNKDGLSGLGGGGASLMGGVVSERGATTMLSKLTTILIAAFIVNSLVMARLAIMDSKATVIEKLQEEQKEEAQLLEDVKVEK